MSLSQEMVLDYLKFHSTIGQFRYDINSLSLSLNDYLPIIGDTFLNFSKRKKSYLCIGQNIQMGAHRKLLQLDPLLLPKF